MHLIVTEQNLAFEPEGGALRSRAWRRAQPWGNMTWAWHDHHHGHDRPFTWPYPRSWACPRTAMQLRCPASAAPPVGAPSIPVVAHGHVHGPAATTTTDPDSPCAWTAPRPAAASFFAADVAGLARAARGRVLYPKGWKAPLKTRPRQRSRRGRLAAGPAPHHPGARRHGPHRQGRGRLARGDTEHVKELNDWVLHTRENQRAALQTEQMGRRWPNGCLQPVPNRRGP